MSYLEILDGYSVEQLSLLAQMKRFFECAQSDPEFAGKLGSGDFSADDVGRLARIGVTFDLKTLSLFWEDPVAVSRIASYYDTIFVESALDPVLLERLRSYPNIFLWFEFAKSWGGFHLAQRQKKISIVTNAAFKGWWKRRVESVRNELGNYGRFLGHGVMAIELSSGCSRRCPFCAYSPEPFRSALPYEDGGSLFRDILEVTIDLLGIDAVGESILYYATEPHDNPSYFEYLSEFTALVGTYPCTSTSVVKDRSWVEKLIDFYATGEAPYPQLSVLSRSDLRYLHENFSPEDLLPLHVSMMMKGSMAAKVKCGDLFEETPGLKSSSINNGPRPQSIPQGSISCVSGFLINLVERTIKLVSPCYGSVKWPLGYRIYDEVGFSDDRESFRAAICGLIERNMFDGPPPDKALRFRDDFDYRETSDGFDLVSFNQIVHITCGNAEKKIGSLIHEGAFSPSALADRLSEMAFESSFAVTSFAEKLFREGLLDEYYR